MRILAIRGHNLASLADPFEVDLTAEPLAGSGLFAITGETGAGKSTILDALCLALYGEYPRVSGGRRESAPDPSGDSISVQDGRAILRRGAGSGYAEVDFIGQDGECYRARWEANRARGRANGRLQAEQRSLLRLRDESVIATGKNPVRDAIVERTDLTFDQFRRTVLLAQGEFDVFLLASEGDRAELLEKITGTEIYAAISVKVHDGTETRRRTVEQLEQRRSDIGLLDDAARQALTAEQCQLNAAAAAKAGERDHIAAKLEHMARVETARSLLKQAETDMAAAHLACDGAASDRQLLAELDAIEPLRPLTIDVCNAARAAQATAAKIVETQDALKKERARDETAAARLVEATTADETAEETFKQFGPLWSQAEQLDAKILSAKAELTRAVEDAGKAETASQQLEQAAVAIEQKIRDATAQRQSAAARLEQQSARAVLADRIDDVSSLLERRDALRAPLTTAAKAAQEAEQKATQLQLEMAEVSTSIEKSRERRDDLGHQLTAHRAALEALDVPALEDQDAVLASLLDLAKEGASTSEGYSRASQALARAEADHATATQESSAASTQVAAAEAQQGRDRAARTEITVLAELADETVSPEAVRLRSALVPGKPCPVCGSADHPHLSAPDALSEMVAATRRANKTHAPAEHQGQ